MTEDEKRILSMLKMLEEENYGKGKSLEELTRKMESMLEGITHSF